MKETEIILAVTCTMLILANAYVLYQLKSVKDEIEPIKKTADQIQKLLSTL